jgi:Cytidine and deoxycytidylate deaminase zinc-binding region
MPYSLVPVDYQPDFSDYSLVPVDYDPFSADGMVQPATVQSASQPQPDAGFNQPPSVPQSPVSAPPLPPILPNDGQAPSAPQPPAQDLHTQYQALRPMLGDRKAMLATLHPEFRQTLIAQARANRQQPGDMSVPEPASGVSEWIAAKIVEFGNDFYNQSILKPARDLRDMGHDLVTDPAYFLHAIGPSLVGIGMSAPATQAGDVGLAERAKEIHNVLDGIAQRMRTTAVLETDAGRIIASGARDLNPAQKAALGPGELAAKAPRLHAEVTALNKAASIGATPSNLAVTRAICPKCANVIESHGGMLTSRKTAIFPRR